jgi:GNAT superfamily N-acetyltransferase
VTVHIRPYRPDDLLALTAVQEQIEPERPLTPSELAAFLTNAHCWLICMGMEIAGYAAVVPAPGLPGDSDLQWGVIPAFSELGSDLLEFVLRELPAIGLRQTSCIVDDLESPTAQFLGAHGFTLDHEEVTLLWTPPPTFAPPVWPPGFSLNVYPLTAVIAHFRQLYEAGFSSRPWYQPYDAAELRGALAADGRSPGEIIFLEHDKGPMGCIWIQPIGPGEWQIEPLIIHPNYQGQGLGRLLLQAGLLEASAQGVSEVSITLWRTNEVAHHLYRQVGFVEDGRCFYLTYAA